MNIPAEIIHFVNEEGKLVSWPAKRSKKIVAIQYIGQQIEANKTFTEAEVSEIINHWHTFSDAALIRREMIENKILDRTKDGRSYWKR